MTRRVSIAKSATNQDRPTGRGAAQGTGRPGANRFSLRRAAILTFAEAIDEISKAVGRELRYVRVSIEEFEAAAAEQGVPAEFAAQLTGLFAEVLDGRNAYLTDGVQRALGREPRDFADYARAAAATGVWTG